MTSISTAEVPAPQDHPKPILLGLAIVAISSGSALACFVSDLSRHETVPWLIVGFAALMGPAFLAVAYARPRISGLAFWSTSIGWRLALMLAVLPGADIYRYIWEASVQLAGFSPYAFAPNAPELEALRGSAWENVEHKAITAIYPPLTQIGFALLAAISPTVLCFKAAFVAADLTICGLLARRFGHRNAVLYAWNPVVLYAIAGGGHYDSWFALALVVAWLLWIPGQGDVTAEIPPPRRLYAACLALGAAIAIKWVALPILGWAVWQLIRKQSVRFACSALILGLLPFAITWPIAAQGLQGALIPQDYAYYARSAEFLPVALEWFWPDSRYRNEVLLIPVLIGGVLLILFNRNYISFNELWFFLLFIFSPVFHLWYLVWLAPFAVASRNWGTLWMSVSVFGYFYLYALPPETAAENWRLPLAVQLIVWLPLVIGFAWKYLQPSDRASVLRNSP